MTARHFDVPVVFAKKAKSKNIDGDVYTSTVHSYAHGKDYNITLAQKFLGPNDRVLILDDFLANGKPCAVCWMFASRPEPVWRASASALKKALAGRRAAPQGCKLASLAIVDEMGDNGSLKFRETEY